MAKKFVRGVTGIEDIESYDKTLTNVNDILSDGENTYVHTKKGKNEFYYKLTDGVSSVNSTGGTISVEKSDDGSLKLDTNPKKVLEHENLAVGDGLSVSHSGNISKIQLDPSLKNAVKGLKKISKAADVVAPYNDLNTLPVNTVVTYAYSDGVFNKPTGLVAGGYTVMTVNYDSNTKGGAFQMLVAPADGTYMRVNWGIGSVWQTWEKIVTEKYLSQNIDVEPFKPSLALFEKIGVIGDSYASGEIYPDGNLVDKYSISWGQILARKNGVSCTNFSVGGITTRNWLINEYGLTKLNATEAQNLYYISLGINDKGKLGLDYLGSEADMDSGADTFYGNYAKIIKAVQAKAPYAKIILIDSAWSTGETDPFFVATKNIATKFGLPLIKHSDDKYLASSQFKNDLMSQGHPVAISYAGMASAFEKLTMKAIRDNIAYFRDYRG